LARTVFAGVPHHVTQRGNRRENVFFTDDDRRKPRPWPPSAVRRRSVNGVRADFFEEGKSAGLGSSTVALFQPFHIGGVLCAAGGALVLDQVFPRQDRGRLIGESARQPGRPGIGERDPLDGGHDVDVQGRHADLEDETGRAEVGLCQVVQGGRTRGVLTAPAWRCRGWPHPDIQNLGGAHMAVGGQGMGADDQVFNALGVEARLTDL
jgi:hypothetical protein